MRKKVQIQLSEVRELRGSYPDVPLAAGVNYEELVTADRAAGQDPMFVTLPLAYFGQVSRNKRRYSEAEVRRMYRRIVESAVTGALGHLRHEDRGFDFDIPAVKWVGAKIVGDELWGKLYVLSNRQDVREYFRVQKASGGKVGTSLYGMAYEDYHEADEVFDVREMDLEQIDIVHPDRVGVLFAATADPGITSETRMQETALEDSEPVPASHQVNLHIPTEGKMSDKQDTGTPDNTDARVIELQETHAEEVG